MIDIKYDPWADKKEVKHEYSLELQNELNTNDYDAVVLAVSHYEFKTLDIKPSSDAVVYDIKSVLRNTDGRL